MKSPHSSWILLVTLFWATSIAAYSQIPPKPVPEPTVWPDPQQPLIDSPVVPSHPSPPWTDPLISLPKPVEPREIGKPPSFSGLARRRLVLMPTRAATFPMNMLFLYKWYLRDTANPEQATIGCLPGWEGRWPGCSYQSAWWDQYEPRYTIDRQPLPVR